MKNAKCEEDFDEGKLLEKSVFVLSERHSIEEAEEEVYA